MQDDPFDDQPGEPTRRLHHTADTRDMMSFNGPTIWKIAAVSSVVSAINSIIAQPGSLLVLPLAPFLMAFSFLIYACGVASLLELEGGRKASLGDAVTVTKRQAKDILGAEFRALLICMGLAITVLGIPWAIKRIVNWFAVTYAIIVDGQPSRDALSFSESLVTGKWWSTAGRLFVVFLVAGIPSGVILVLGAVVDLPLVAKALIGIPTSMFGFVYALSGTAIIYNDLRRQKALDVAFTR